MSVKGDNESNRAATARQVVDECRGNKVRGRNTTTDNMTHNHNDNNVNRHVHAHQQA